MKSKKFTEVFFKCGFIAVWNLGKTSASRRPCPARLRMSLAFSAYLDVLSYPASISSAAFLLISTLPNTFSAYLDTFSYRANMFSFATLLITPLAYLDTFPYPANISSLVRDLITTLPSTFSYPTNVSSLASLLNSTPATLLLSIWTLFRTPKQNNVRYYTQKRGGREEKRERVREKEREVEKVESNKRQRGKEATNPGKIYPLI